MYDLRTYISQDFLLRLIEDRLSISEANEYIRKCESDILSKNRFNILLLRYNGVEESFDKAVNELKKEMVDVEYLFATKDFKYIIFLIGYKEEESSNMDKIYRNIKSFVRQHTEYALNASLGKRVPDIMNVSLSYTTAQKTMELLFVGGYGNTNSHLENENSFGKLYIDGRLYNDFLNGLTKFDTDFTYSSVNKIEDIILSSTGITIGQIKAVYFKLMEILANMSSISKNIEEESSDIEMISSIISILNMTDTMSDCHNQLFDMLNDYFDDSKEFANSSRTIINIIEYIKTNYSNPKLTVEEIADSVFITPNYMNTVFKKKFGTTVWQYITNFRINKAKELLSDSNIRLNDISKLVGYSDPGYFSKAFKKNTQMTPKLYRENVRK